MPLVARLFLAMTKKVASTIPHIAKSPTIIGMTMIAISPADVPDLSNAYDIKEKLNY